MTILILSPRFHSLLRKGLADWLATLREQALCG